MAQVDLFPKKESDIIKLTILSFGGGQDSTAILYMIIAGVIPVDKKHLVVVFADTMNEHEETYKHIHYIKNLCYANGIVFKDLGDRYVIDGWKGGLISFYHRGNRIGSKCFPKTCTANLKIDPIYNWLEEYLHIEYGMTNYGNKKAIKEFAKKHTKIDVLIGIARKEEKRASTNEESPSVWMRTSINKVYPLIEMGMDRQDCQDYIKSEGHEVPSPSNCILCPFMSEQELLYLYRFHKPWYYKWVILERNKIKANAYKGDLTKTWAIKKQKIVDNMGVWGKKLLPEKLEEAIEKFGHMTDEELKEYKMSHGHCVMSKY